MNACMQATTIASLFDSLRKRYRDGDEPVKRSYFEKSSDYMSLKTEKGCVKWISKTRCTNGPDYKFRPNCHFTHGTDN